MTIFLAGDLGLDIFGEVLWENSLGKLSVRGGINIPRFLGGDRNLSTLRQNGSKGEHKGELWATS